MEVSPETDDHPRGDCLGLLARERNRFGTAELEETTQSHVDARQTIRLRKWRCSMKKPSRSRKQTDVDLLAFKQPEKRCPNNRYPDSKSARNHLVDDSDDGSPENNPIARPVPG